MPLKTPFQNLTTQLAQAREARGMTPERLAELADYSAAQLRKLEGGHSKDIRLANLQKIATALGATIIARPGKRKSFNYEVELAERKTPAVSRANGTAKSGKTVRRTARKAGSNGKVTTGDQLST